MGDSSTPTILTYVDLFSGIGGFRYGIQLFESKFTKYKFKCIKTVDIKKDAIKTYNYNFNETNDICDICTVKDLGYFDILCAGFPCQPFSSAGNKKGLEDEHRGGLIFEVIRICKESRPNYLILENVSNIEKINKGETLKTIVKEFESIGYNIVCSMINSSEVGLAQDRKRLFIVGSRTSTPVIVVKPRTIPKFVDVIDLTDKETTISKEFIEMISKIPAEELVGKSFKDKRGGDDNIHSWEIGYHGTVTDQQKILLNKILLERRKKKWAQEKNIKWMDGIPLSLKDIKSFCDYDDLQKDLDELVSKKYLAMSYPQDLINGQRICSTTLDIGYNISKGKLSFPISKIIHPDKLCPTLTATDSSKLAVQVSDTIRQLNETELKTLCGFPDHFKLPKGVKKFDLFGNMVCPPVITEILESLLPLPA